MLRYCVIVPDSYRDPLQNDLRWLLRRGSPLPIPNREVKPACADGTAICGRVCRRLSLLSPSFFKLGLFFYRNDVFDLWAWFVAFLFENPHHLFDEGFLFVFIILRNAISVSPNSYRESARFIEPRLKQA